MTHLEQAFGAAVLAGSIASALLWAHPAQAGRCRDDTYNRARHAYQVSLTDRPAAHVPSGLPWAGCGTPNLTPGNRLDTGQRRKSWIL